MLLKHAASVKTDVFTVTFLSAVDLEESNGSVDVPDSSLSHSLTLSLLSCGPEWSLLLKHLRQWDKATLSAQEESLGTSKVSRL